MLRKLLHELPMLGLGAGVAVAGASLVTIMVPSLPKAPVVGGLVTAASAYLSYVGVQVTIGTVERVMGKR